MRTSGLERVKYLKPTPLPSTSSFPTPERKALYQKMLVGERIFEYSKRDRCVAHSTGFAKIPQGLNLLGIGTLREGMSITLSNGLADIRRPRFGWSLKHRSVFVKSIQMDWELGLRRSLRFFGVDHATGETLLAGRTRSLFIAASLVPLLIPLYRT
jgi:hypothetical protein